MENLVKIAEGVLTSCLAVKPGEEILVITDDSRKEIGEAIYEAAGNLGCEKILMVMKEREVSGQEPPKVIAEAMKAADVVIAPTAQSLTHTNARIEAAKAGARVATMPGITREMFSQGAMTADYSKVEELTAKVSRQRQLPKDAMTNRPVERPAPHHRHCTSFRTYWLPIVSNPDSPSEPLQPLFSARAVHINILVKS